MTSRFVRQFARVVGVTLVLASQYSCSPDIAKDFEYGEAVPDARLRVQLVEPVDRIEFVRRFAGLAERNGFNVYRGKEISAELVNGPAMPRFFFWYAPESSNLNPYSVGFSWERTNQSKVSQFQFIFGKGAVGSFVEQDWLFFKRWKDDVIQSEFLGAHIEISRHPAENTDPDQLQQIAEMTEMSVPENR